jgi:Ala-tRNA(Pro) deacylase
MSESTIDTGFELVERYLADQELEHSIIEHPITYTAAAEARISAVEPAHTAKTVMLRDDDGYVMAVIPASETLSVHRLRRIASRPGLRLATEGELERDLPAFEVGAIPPIGALVGERGYIDYRVLLPHRILCNAGDHRHSVVLDAGALARLCGARVADLCADTSDAEAWDEPE